MRRPSGAKVAVSDWRRSSSVRANKLQHYTSAPDALHGKREPTERQAPGPGEGREGRLGTDDTSNGDHGTIFFRFLGHLALQRVFSTFYYSTSL